MKPLLSTLLALCAGSAALAQAPATQPPASATTENPQKLPEVVITAEKDKGYKAESPSSVTRMKEPVIDSARSVQVVTPQLIQDRAIVNPQDAIQTVSGVQRSAYNTGHSETYIVRGFRQQNYIKDGFRAGNVAGSNPVTINAGPPTDVANLQSVEVLKGPAAVEFGRGEPGGLVNYVTRDAEFDNNLGIQQMIGSFGYYRAQVNTNWTAVPEVLAMRLDLGYEQGGSFIDQVDGDRSFVSSALRWNLAERTTLSIKAEYSHDDHINTPGLPYQNRGVFDGVPTDRFMGERDFTRMGTDSFRSLVKLEHEWNDAHKTTLSVHGVETSQEGGYFILFNFGSPPVPAGFPRAAADLQLTEQNFTVRLDHLYKAEFAHAIQNDLLVSLEYDYQRNNTHRSLYSHTRLDPLNPAYTGFAPGPIFGAFPLDEFLDVDAASWSAMFMNRLNIHEKVFLTLGARVEWFQASMLSFYNSPFFPTTNTESEQLNFNPSAGIVVKPASNVSLYASFAQSTNSWQNVNRRTASGGGLDPESSRMFEVGTKAEFFDGSLLASLAFFQIDKTNVAAADPANPLFSINGGSERSRGFEFDLNGEIAKGWNVSFNYAYIDTRIRSSQAAGLSGSRRPGVPENSGGIFTTYEIQEGALKGLGFGGGLFMSDRVNNSPGNAGTLPGYAQTDALVYYKLGKARFQLNVKNLFDNDIYFSQGQATMVQAAPGRTFLASVRFDF
ncbi:MAG: TonB-dependent siderophore receptor [Prosthecobacter sp.]|jgi:iron complex outermembrane receptor protein|uniref:TonB-dependent siderophore receptor n=1 Tax=Prosthecobacter sp. TaxID=1965333 RepID=UPI0019F6D039|nr:TonB-dependent siderophore receptor [Prosthecobacter sp.]MBE2284402.1 TonB-dependent siderophore receptor [Prosthecobacter sp.]